MLKIPKKKLLLAKWLMWGGWTITAVSLAVAVIFAKIQKFPLHVGARVCLGVALFACIAMIYGLLMLLEMYVCPKCAARVLMRGMKPSEYCFKCGEKITVEIVEG